DQTASHLKACTGIELQPELREFDGNSRVELLPSDFIERVEIDLNGASRLIQVVNVFAENIECSAETFGIEAGDHAHRVVGCFAGNVSIGDTPNNAFGNYRQRAGDHSIEERHFCELCAFLWLIS